MELDILPGFPFGNILVITGERGAGKTTFCQKAVDQYRAKGLTASGILCPGRFADGHKTGIFALDLRSGESRLLASLVKNEIEGINFGPWVFDPRVLDWGNQIVKRSVETDLLVIDEIGPLEFDHQMGWTASFDVLKSAHFGLAMVVIRIDCLKQFSDLGYRFDVKWVPNQQP